MTEPMQPPQLIEQARAAYALDWLRRMETSAEVDTKELKSWTRRLPGMIQTNGFGQAVAFYYAKREKIKSAGALYTLLERWLTEPSTWPEGFEPVYADFARQRTPLLHGITAGDQHLYRHATAEARALLRWAKKFAEALSVEDESRSRMSS